jgi:hypothetical protein
MAKLLDPDELQSRVLVLLGGAVERWSIRARDVARRGRLSGEVACTLAYVAIQNGRLRIAPSRPFASTASVVQCPREDLNLRPTV